MVGLEAHINSHVALWPQVLSLFRKVHVSQPGSLACQSRFPCPHPRPTARRTSSACPGPGSPGFSWIQPREALQPVRSGGKGSGSQVSPLPPSSSPETTATSCSSGHRGVLASGWAPLGASPVCSSSEEGARVVVRLSSPLPARSVCTCLPCAVCSALQTFRDTRALPLHRALPHLPPTESACRGPADRLLTL